MIETAVRSGISASRVLFDSWFCSPSTLISVSVKERDMDVIAMAKKVSKVYYMYKGQMLPVTEIYRKNRKRRGRSRYLLFAEIRICSRDGNCSIPAKLVYVRNKSKHKDYLVLISTDMTLSEDEMIRIYGKRGDRGILQSQQEISLKLTKECHSLHYNAMAAYVAVVFAKYMMLAIENRIRRDERTFGEISTMNTFTLFLFVSFMSMLLIILSVRSEVTFMQLTEQEFMKR